MLTSLSVSHVCVVQGVICSRARTLTRTVDPAEPGSAKRIQKPIRLAPRCETCAQLASSCYLPRKYCAKSCLFRSSRDARKYVQVEYRHAFNQSDLLFTAGHTMLLRVGHNP
jgi:hypothetical protein